MLESPGGGERFRCEGPRVEQCLGMIGRFIEFSPPYPESLDYFYSASKVIRDSDSVDLRISPIMTENDLHPLSSQLRF